MLFAGTTVVIALLGLLVLNTETFRGVAIGTAIGVLITLLGSLTLLPALLGFVGRNIDRFGLPRRHRDDAGRTPFWKRWSHMVQRRPWPAFVGALVVLVVIALPVFSMRLGFGDAGNNPKGDTSREAYDLLAKGFGPGLQRPADHRGEDSRRAERPRGPERSAQQLNATRGSRSPRPRGRTRPATRRSCR